MLLATTKTFWLHGQQYCLADKGTSVPNLEPLSSRHAAHVLRGLMLAEPRVFSDLCRMFRFASRDAVLHELERHRSPSEGGMCRVELFRRPERLQLLPPHVRPTPLKDLILDDEILPEHWVEVELHDRAKDPVSGIHVEVVTPEGKHRRRRTNGFGLLRIDGISKPGQCTVLVPEPDASDVPPEPPPPKETLSFKLLDPEGDPCAHQRISIELADGTRRTATTDAKGAVRLAGVRSGRCLISVVESAPSEEPG